MDYSKTTPRPNGFYSGFYIALGCVLLCAALAVFLMVRPDPSAEVRWLQSISHLYISRAKTIEQDKSDMFFTKAQGATISAISRRPMDRELWADLKYIYAQQETPDQDAREHAGAISQKLQKDAP